MVMPPDEIQSQVSGSTFLIRTSWMTASSRGSDIDTDSEEAIWRDAFPD